MRKRVTGSGNVEIAAIVVRCETVHILYSKRLLAAAGDDVRTEVRRWTEMCSETTRRSSNRENIKCSKSRPWKKFGHEGDVRSYSEYGGGEYR